MLVLRVSPVENVRAASLAFHVAALAIYESATAVPFHIPVLIVPNAVKLDVTTLLANVVPVNVPAAAAAALLPGAFITKLPLESNPKL